MIILAKVIQSVSMCIKSLGNRNLDEMEEGNGATKHKTKLKPCLHYTDHPAASPS